jgi:tRNA modification GTPase
MERVLALGDRGERLREGLTIVLAGPPNSGKSTLLNVLARRDIAIVSPIAGTTRDIVEARLDLGGYAVTLLDTAGMRETDDPIEQEGVRRMLERAELADIVLWLNSAACEAVLPPASMVRSGIKLIEITTQIDRITGDTASLGVSAVTGAGIDWLVERLTELSVEQSASGQEGTILTRARHQQAVSRALEALKRALTILPFKRVELVAEEVRLALRSIGEITGHVGVEDVLDQLFFQFCIGK